MPLLLCCTQFIAAAQQQPALTMPQAVQRALDKYPAVRSSMEQVVKFDPGLRRIYAASSSGVIAVYKEQDAQHFRKIEDFPVQKTVHSLAVDTSSHRVYAPEEEEDGHPVAQMVVYEAVVEKEKK